MDLDAIENRANAATEGPWEYDGRTLWGRDDIGRIKAVTPEDRVFTAAARTDVPDLVARVRELEAENGKLRDDLETAAGNNGHIVISTEDSARAIRIRESIAAESMRDRAAQVAYMHAPVNGAEQAMSAVRALPLFPEEDE